MKKTFILISIFLISSQSLFSHGGEKHDEKVTKKVEVKENDVLKMKYTKINETYQKDIKPIFEAKCFNCHSNTTNFPFYYKIPGVKSLIDNDIKEAKKHIDFSDDFPFISHETPINDIKSLRKVALEGGMPPLRYIVAHWDSKLSDENKKAMLDWTNQALDILEEK